jgi:hypothetical protein
MTATINQYTHKEWLEEAARLFGENSKNWKFVCPSCCHVASVADWKAVGAEAGEVAFSCVGRHMEKASTIFEKPGPCNYAGGGLFRLNPITVTDDEGNVHSVFAFAEPPT